MKGWVTESDAGAGEPNGANIDRAAPKSKRRRQCLNLKSSNLVPFLRFVFWIAPAVTVLGCWLSSHGIAFDEILKATNPYYSTFICNITGYLDLVHLQSAVSESFIEERRFLQHVAEFWNVNAGDAK